MLFLKFSGAVSKTVESSAMLTISVRKKGDRSFLHRPRVDPQSSGAFMTNQGSPCTGLLLLIWSNQHDIISVLDRRGVLWDGRMFQSSLDYVITEDGRVTYPRGKTEHEYSLFHVRVNRF